MPICHLCGYESPLLVTDICTHHLLDDLWLHGWAKENKMACDAIHRGEWIKVTMDTVNLTKMA